MTWINCAQQLPPLNQNVFIKTWDGQKYIGGCFDNWTDEHKNGVLTINGHKYDLYNKNLTLIFWLKED